MDLEPRHLRAFVAVAEELHFSRAAQRLFITQPALTRQVRLLEGTLGVELLRRTTRKVELTEAGAAFLGEARAALAQLERAADAAHRGARGAVGTLRVGFATFAGSEPLGSILARFRTDHPRVEIGLRSFGFEDPTAGLLSGDSDASLVRLPIPHPKIHTQVLLREPRCFALSAQHPLAVRPSLSLADVEDQPVLRLVGQDDDPIRSAWGDFWELQLGPDGRRRPVAAHIHNSEEWLQALSDPGSLAITTTAASAAELLARPGIVFVPAPDLAPSLVAVAWRADHTTPLVRAFTATAARCDPGSSPPSQSERPRAEGVDPTQR